MKEAFLRSCLVMSLLCFVLLLKPAPTFAACEPDGTHKSDLIICDNSDLDGIDSGKGDDFITILLGAIIDIDITNPSDGLRVVGVEAGSGNDTVTNNGSIAVKVTDKQDDPISVKVIGINGGHGKDDITNNGQLVVDLSLESGDDALAVGIGDVQSRHDHRRGDHDKHKGDDKRHDKSWSSGNGGDSVDNRAQLKVTAKSTDSGLTLPGIPIHDQDLDANTILNANALGITSSYDDDEINNANTGVIDITSIAELNDINFDITLTGTTAVDATITLNSKATGIDTGNGMDTVGNDGIININAISKISNYSGEFNLVDTTHSDSSRFLFSTAKGISTGNSKDTIHNTGDIFVNASSESTSGSFVANGAASALVDSELEVDAFTVGIDSGRGKDQIFSSGTINTTATAEVDDVSVNLTFVDVTILDGEGGSNSTTLDATSVGINSGLGNDYIELTDTSVLNAVAKADVHSLGIALASEGVPGSVSTLIETGSLADIGITSQASAIAIDSGKGHDQLTLQGIITSEAMAEASQENINVGIAVFDFKLPTPGIVIGGAGTEAKADAIGVMLGDGHNEILHRGLLDVDATSDASATAVSLNIAELSIDFIPDVPGIPLGISFVGADTSTQTNSNAAGIIAGDGHDTIYISSDGVMEVDAKASSGSTSISASLDIKYEKGDNFLAIDGVLARAVTEAVSSVNGIDAGDGKNVITNAGSLSAASYADTTNVGAAITLGGTLRGAGGALGLAATDTSNEATATTNGIIGGKNTDYIYNKGQLNVSADADINNVNVSTNIGITQQGAVIGVGLARSEAIAEASVTGIDAGKGHDFINNTNQINLNARSEVDSINISATIEAALDQGLAAGVALVDASSEAITDVTAISGGKGGDTIHNNGMINVNSVTADTNTVGIGASFTFAKQGLAVGVALADSRADAEANVIGIDGGSGHDELLNQSNIVLQNINSDANALSVSVGAAGADKGVAIGVALTDATASATTNLVGMDAGTNDDVVTNNGTVSILDSRADAHAAGISVELAGTNSGVSAGVSIADTLGVAELSAKGIDGAAGDDLLINNGDIFLQNLQADADSVSVGVTLNVALSAGLASGASMSNASAIANLWTVGIEDLEDDNKIINNDLISLYNIESTATGVGVSVQLGVTSTGVALGAALADTSANANTSASGIITGAGDDQLWNIGDITFSQIKADADAVSVSVQLNAALKGGVAGGLALTDAGAHADVTVMGISAGAGDDYIKNKGKIISDGIEAISDATSVSVSLSGTAAGLGVGVALADTTATTQATAIGIDGGRGNDVIKNFGLIDFDTKSEVDSASVSVSLAIAPVGISVALTDATSTAEANTIGIDGAAGNDEIFNAGNIISGADAQADATSVSVGLAVGPSVTIADVESIAKANAIGIYSGARVAPRKHDDDDKGHRESKSHHDYKYHNESDYHKEKKKQHKDDWSEKIVNVGDVQAAAIADAEGTSVAVSLAGYSLGESTSTATANAHAIKTEGGKDEINNHGTLTATANSTADGLSVGVSVLGAAFANATTTANATANGIASSAGNDKIINKHEITTQSNAASSAAAGGFALLGVASADATSNATAISIGIDAGESDDVIFNVGSITSMAGDANADGITSAINCDDSLGGACTDSQALGLSLLGYAPANAASTSTALAVGIDGGDDHDKIINKGVIDVSALARGNSRSLSITLVGASVADATSTSTATAMGLTGASGDDHIFNSSSITVSAAAVGRAKSFGFSGIGGSDIDADVTTFASAVGISGGSGNDKIVNSQQITASTNAFGLANSKSVNLVGQSKATADASTTSSATGMDGGSQNDTLINLDLIVAKATSTADVRSSTFNLAGVASSKGAITADALATGMSAGLGADHLYNKGGIDVDANIVANSRASTLAIFGNANTSSGIKGTATAIGMAGGGEHGDEIANLDWIDVLARSVATANGDNFSLAGGASASAFITADSDATGISGSQGHDKLDNKGMIKVVADSTAITGQDVSVGLGGDAKTGADITAVATARGIASDQGNDRILNEGDIDVSVVAKGNAFGDSQSGIFSGQGFAVSKGDVTSTGFGVELGAGKHKFYNKGTVKVSATATMVTTAIADGSNLSNGDATTDAISNAGVLVYGVWADEGNTKIYNHGSITVLNNAFATADSHADGDGFFGGGNGDGFTSTLTSAGGVGLALASGRHKIMNAGTITVRLKANPNASTQNHDADAFGDGDSSDSNADFVVTATTDGTTGKTTVSARTKGIVLTGDHNNSINGNEITVTSLATAVPIVIADTSGAAADADARSNNSISAHADGLSVTGNYNYLYNHGLIAIEADASAICVRSRGCTDSDTTQVDSDADTFEKTTVIAKSNGMLVQGMHNEISNRGEIIVSGLSNATSRLRAEATSGTDANADVLSSSQAKALTDVSGIRSVDGADWITNRGHIAVTADSIGNMNSVALGGTIDGDARAYATGIAETFAYGIRTDQLTVGNDAILNDHIVNKSDIMVRATAKAFATAFAEEDAGGTSDELASGTATATARSFGIYTGNGHDTVINYGNINVTAVATASVSVDTEDNDRERGNPNASAQAVGIYTGAGDDLIVNHGTITASAGASGGPATATREAIQAGAGDDTVTLKDGSVVNGDVDLGADNDTLNLVGSPTINGTIRGAEGINNLAFIGSGYFDFANPATDFHKATKTGEGTYTLSALAPMQHIEVEQGVLEINSDYEFAAGSTFMPSVSSGDGNGRLVINGAVNFSAASISIMKGRGHHLDGDKQTVLYASQGILNSMSFNNIKLPEKTPLLEFHHDITADEVQVSTSVASFQTVASSNNQRVIARYMDEILPNAEGDASEALGEIQSMKAGKHDSAFSSVNPETYVNTQQAFESSVRNYTSTLQQRTRGLRNTKQYNAFVQPGFLATAEQGEPLFPNLVTGNLTDALNLSRKAYRPYGAWAKAYRQNGQLDQTATNSGFDFDSTGYAFGFDNWIDQRRIIGLSMATSTTDLDADNNRTRSDIESQLVSLYSSYVTDKGYVDGSLTYGYNTYQTQRDVTIGNINSTVFSEHNGDVYGASAGGGLFFPIKTWDLEVYGALQYLQQDEEGFQESGAGGVSLNVNPRKSDLLSSELGFRFGKQFKKKNSSLFTEFGAAWFHEFSDDSSVQASFVGSSNSSFTVDGQDIDDDGVLLNAGLSYINRKGVTGTAEYRTEIRDGYTDQIFFANIQYQFD